MNLLGKGTDPKFWSETVRNKDCFKEYRDFLFDRWEKVCKDDILDVSTYTDFRLYGLTGNRTVYQGP